MKNVILNFANRYGMFYAVILSMVITFTLWGDTTVATTSIDSFVKSGLSPKEAGEWLKLVEKFGIGTAFGVFILISTIVPIVRSYVKRTDLLANDINDKISDQNDTLTRLEIKLDASLKGVSGYISKEQTCILDAELGPYLDLESNIKRKVEIIEKVVDHFRETGYTLRTVVSALKVKQEQHN